MNLSQSFSSALLLIALSPSLEETDGGIDLLWDIGVLAESKLGYTILSLYLKKSASFWQDKNSSPDIDFWVHAKSLGWQMA